MENIEKTTEVSFHGQDYILKLVARDENLYVEIEQKDTGFKWKNSFSASYIEEITQKTGNYKKYNIFVKMLASALTRNTDSVFLDILTLQDLEMLKARKQKGSLNSTQSVDKSRMNNKRYMILTYVVEFDKVHYPLPLNYEENPDVESLKATIKRMRLEIEDLKVQGNSTPKREKAFFLTGAEEENQGNKDPTSQSEYNLMKSENEYLKDKCRKYEEALSTQGAIKNKGIGAVEFDILLKAKIDLENELEDVKKDYVRDIKKLKIKLDETDAELEECRNELMQSKAENKENFSANKRSSNSRGEDNEAELSYSKKVISRHQQEIERLSQDLETMKSQDRKQKNRIKQLEQELESSLKRATYSRGSTAGDRTNSPYTRSRGASPTLSSSKRSSSVPTRVFSPVAKPQVKQQSPMNKNPRVPSRTSTGSESSNRGTGLYNQRTVNSPGTGIRNSRTANSPGTGIRNQRTANSPGTGIRNQKTANSPLRINGNSYNDPSHRTTPKRETFNSNTNINSNSNSFGTRKPSPKGRTFSPLNRSPAAKPLTTGKPLYTSQGNSGLKASTRGGKANAYITDSEDEQHSSKRRESDNIFKRSVGYGQSTTSSANQSNLRNLKGNINDFGTSKRTPTAEQGREKKLGYTNTVAQTSTAKKDLDSSIDVQDIDEKLNKLQDLIKQAKS